MQDGVPNGSPSLCEARTTHSLTPASLSLPLSLPSPLAPYLPSPFPLQESDLSTANSMVVFARLLIVSPTAFTTLIVDASAHGLVPKGCSVACKRGREGSAPLPLRDTVPILVPLLLVDAPSLPLIG